MITKKQIFESSKGKQSIEVRKKFVEQIMKIVKNMPDIEKNTESFESNAELLQRSLSDGNLKHYFNSEKKSNSFRLFKSLRDAINFYFEAKNSDENNAQKIYDKIKILKSETNLKLDKSFKISSIEKNDAKTIFSLIKTICRKSISLLDGKYDENISFCAKVIVDFRESYWNFIGKYYNKYREMIQASDISELENSYEKLLYPIEQNKRYFRNYKDVIKQIHTILNFLENQKKFWVKYPNFNYRDYINWLKLQKDGNSLYLNINFDAIGRLRKCIRNTDNDKYEDDLYEANLRTICASKLFYKYRGDDKTEHCKNILTENYLSNLENTLIEEVEKPIKDRKPLKNLINKFLKDTPKELISKYKVRKHLNNWLLKYKIKYLSLNDKVLNYCRLNSIHDLMYLYMFSASSEVEECLSNLIETLSVEVKKSIKSRKPLKKLIDKFLKDTSKKLIQDDVRKCLKDWLSKYNNKSLSLNDKMPSLSLNLREQMKKVHDLMYSYLLPPAFDARKIGKANTTEDIDVKTKNKEKRRSLK